MHNAPKQCHNCADPISNGALCDACFELSRPAPMSTDTTIGTDDLAREALKTTRAKVKGRGPPRPRPAPGGQMPHAEFLRRLQRGPAKTVLGSPVNHSTTFFDGPEPTIPEVSYTPNGIFLRMDEHGLQALAIMARVYLEVINQDMWDAFNVTGVNEYLHASKELAEQISDLT